MALVLETRRTQLSRPQTLPLRLRTNCQSSVQCMPKSKAGRYRSANMRSHAPLTLASEHQVEPRHRYWSRRGSGLVPPSCQAKGQETTQPINSDLAALVGEDGIRLEAREAPQVGKWERISSPRAENICMFLQYTRAIYTFNEPAYSAKP